VAKPDTSRASTLQTLFKRYRRPGDIVFAWFVLIVSIFLLTQLSAQTTAKNGAQIFTQPRFWPAVSLIGMVGFAAFHLIGSALSERIDGRWREVLSWFAALEYAGWFIAYAAVVPIIGYLPATLIIAVLLTLRVGYRRDVYFWAAALSAVVIVVLFRTFLKVNLPAGKLYEALPDGIRQIMLTYF